jgi:LysM repeat protein
MKRSASVILLFLSLSSVLSAKENLIDCRVIVGGIRECIPYSSKLLKAKEIDYQKSRKKLIVDKTLPVPQKPNHLKVISVEDMIERYVKVEDSKRYKGTEERIDLSKYRKKTEKQEILKPREKAEETVVTSEQNTTVVEVKEKEPVQQPYGRYTVRKGDTISKIALMFGMKRKDVIQMNGIEKKDHLRIGQKLQLPFSQKIIDSIVSASYEVQEGDTLIDIAKKFHLDPKELATYNSINNMVQVSPGKRLKLPLPYVKAAEKKAKEKKRTKAKRQKTYSSKFIRGFGRHKLRVTATAYSSHSKQTDATPFIAAWNNRLRPGMKVIAVSRDLLYKYGMKNGTKVKISGLPGYYRVRDKMNKRYRRRIDIYMGTNRRKALKWGRRSVVIYW